MRSIWKGHIRFSLVTIPIRVYNAIDSAETIRFNQLHKSCNGPIGYDKRCKKCSQLVSMQDIVKGFQYEPEQYVIVEPSDFEKLKLESTKIIEIEGFVDASEVHPTLYEAPYFAGPDTPVATKAYALLCEALKQSGKVGVGKVVLREREDAVIIAPHEKGLVLYKLRYPNEVRDIKEVPQLDQLPAIDQEQLKLAQHLMDTMATTLDAIEIRDRYNEAMREMIDAKIQGREIVSVTEEPKPVVDIMTALKQSIEHAKTQRQGMVKATGKTRKDKEEAVPDETPAPAATKSAKARKRA
jgi:DNA end-binding protein Ku